MPRTWKFMVKNELGEEVVKDPENPIMVNNDRIVVPSYTKQAVNYVPTESDLVPSKECVNTQSDSSLDKAEEEDQKSMDQTAETETVDKAPEQSVDQVTETEGAEKVPVDNEPSEDGTARATETSVVSKESTSTVKKYGNENHYSDFLRMIMKESNMPLDVDAKKDSAKEECTAQPQPCPKEFLVRGVTQAQWNRLILSEERKLRAERKLLARVRNQSQQIKTQRWAEFPFQCHM